MTPDAIVKTARQEALAVIAIADHNEISNVAKAISSGVKENVLVVPAIELSTPQGHLLCYFSTVDVLRQFHGRLTFAEPHSPNSRCSNSMFECLKACQDLKGFCVLAHVDGEKGFEREVPGSGPHKLDVIAHPALLGIEIKQATSDVSYCSDDPDEGRKAMGKKRVEHLQLGSRNRLARLMNSDAHSLNVLGKNARGDRKLTRIKMQSPSFEALRLALEDADARVRIEDEIPTAVPHVVGLHMAGGFISDQTIHFSPNLNCIIGGRGTGKSTTFEAIRCLSPDGGQGYMVDSEVWPNSIAIFWRDQSGQVSSLSRPLGGQVDNLDDPDGPTTFLMDCFGQGDAARISEDAKDSPAALLQYLDRFIDFGEHVKSQEEVRQALLTSQTEIEKAQQQVELMPAWKQRFQSAQTQIATLEKANAKEVLGLQRQLAEQKQLRIQFRESIKSMKEDISSEGIEDAANVLCALGRVEGGPVASELTKLHKAADILSKELKTANSALREHFTHFEAIALACLSEWQQRDTEANATIEKKRQALEAQGIKLDMAYIQKLATDEAKAKQNLVAIESWKKKLQSLKHERFTLLKSRWSARSKIALAHTGYALSASKTLKSTLTDLQVSLKYIENAYSPDAETLITQTMGWRTIQVPRAAALVGQLTVPKLLKAIEKEDTSPIISLKSDGVNIFSEHDARQIIERLKAPDVTFALERIEINDLPRITVTKLIKVPAKPSRPHTRDFSQLSLGQQQSILLALILSSSSNHPLIIDQPEDNLDSEFIYWTLVPILRRAKERRQIIVVTHNANIAVLSDAEQIVVLKSTSDKATIVARGSIDDAQTRESACGILEGAKEAFLARGKIYGFR